MTEKSKERQNLVEKDLSYETGMMPVALPPALEDIDDAPDSEAATFMDYLNEVPTERGPPGAPAARMHSIDKVPDSLLDDPDVRYRMYLPRADRKDDVLTAPGRMTLPGSGQDPAPAKARRTQPPRPLRRQRFPHKSPLFYLVLDTRPLEDRQSAGSRDSYLENWWLSNTSISWRNFRGQIAAAAPAGPASTTAIR